MKCIAAVEVDLNQSSIGTKSRLAQMVRGVPVLTRTLRRLAECTRVSKLFVLSPPEQISAVQSLVPSDLERRVEVRANRIATAPFRELVRTARKWSLDGWRGGLGGTCSLDEYTRSDELALLAHGEKADALLCAPAAAPLIDPQMNDRLIEHTDKTAEESKLTFAQAPPGMVGTVYRTELLIDMGQKHIPPGLVLSYKPDAPMMDLAHKTCCFNAPESVRRAVGRLIVDTERALNTVDEFLAADLPVDAETIGRWLIDRSARPSPDLPREVEIELTTEDQLPDALLRPRGAGVGRRGPMDLSIVEKIATELSRYDDSLVVLGGFGEPLLHPKFDDVLRILRERGVYGVAVRTNGLALDDAHIDSLIRHRIDIVNVLLDAWTPQLYAKLQGLDRLEQVKEAIQRLATVRAERSCVAPLIVPEMTKSVETIDEMDSFFDGWVRECGSANFTGYSHYADQRPERSVMTMSPPTRAPCRRILHRLTVLADGRVPLCDQDFTGRHAVGSLKDQSLAKLWQGLAMTNARQCHTEGSFDAIPLCPRCDEWHRP